MTKLDHISIAVASADRSRDWYMQNLGLSVEFEVPTPRAVALQDSDGFTLFATEESFLPVAGNVALYFQVESVVAAHDELTAKGVPIEHGPSKVFWGYGVQLRDPDGYIVRLWDQASMKANE